MRNAVEYHHEEKINMSTSAEPIWVQSNYQILSLQNWTINLAVAETSYLEETERLVRLDHIPWHRSAPMTI